MAILTDLRRQLDQLFGQNGSQPKASPDLAVSYPAVNLWGDDDFVYVEAELPGHQLPDLDIAVAGENRLTIKGRRKKPAPEKAKWHRQERGFGVFEKSIHLPVSVLMDATDVDARLENGVLTIKMPKSPQAKPRKIPVKAD